MVKQFFDLPCQHPDHSTLNALVGNVDHENIGRRARQLLVLKSNKEKRFGKTFSKTLT